MIGLSKLSVFDILGSIWSGFGSASNLYRKACPGKVYPVKLKSGFLLGI
jgi:hypothetical protein